MCTETKASRRGSTGLGLLSSSITDLVETVAALEKKTVARDLQHATNWSTGRCSREDMSWSTPWQQQGSGSDAHGNALLTQAAAAPAAPAANRCASCEHEGEPTPRSEDDADIFLQRRRSELSSILNDLTGTVACIERGAVQDPDQPSTESAPPTACSGSDDQTADASKKAQGSQEEMTNVFVDSDPGEENTG
eukprot:188510-Prymnesium_polylepis.1